MWGDRVSSVAEIVRQRTAGADFWSERWESNPQLSITTVFTHFRDML